MAASLNMNEDPSPSETEGYLLVDGNATEISSMDCDNCCVYDTRQLLDGTVVYAIKCGQRPNHTMHYLRANMGIPYNRRMIESTGCPKPRCKRT